MFGVLVVFCRVCFLCLCVALRWFQWPLTKRRAHTHYYTSDDDPSDTIVVHITPSAYTTTWSSEPRDAQICELLSSAHAPVTTCTSFTVSANFLHTDFVLLFSISMLYTNTSHTLRAPTHYVFMSLRVRPLFPLVSSLRKRGRFRFLTPGGWDKAILAKGYTSTINVDASFDS